MTNKEAGYIIGTLKDNDEYDICQIQEAKGKAVDLLWALSEESTNGEVIKILFPKLHMYSDFDYWKVDLGETVVEFNKKWWNASYKEAEHEVKICDTCAHYGEDLHGAHCRFCSDKKLWKPKEG